MRLAAIFSLVIAIIYILFQSLDPSYYMHLYPDVFAFNDRATFFWENFSLEKLGHNEYQPGAITFFSLLSPVYIFNPTLEGFKWALFTANVIFISFIGYFLIKLKKTEGVFLMSVLLIFLGPILLFRFDALVILLLIISLYFWEKGRQDIAMIILAFSVITKVYPIIFLPYLLYQHFKKGNRFDCIFLFLIFLGSLLGFFSAYTFIFQINPQDTFTSYNFHNLKSVATESVWATVIYFFHLITFKPLPAMESAYGINAIARNEVFPSIQFYNYFWILPTGLLYLLYIIKNKNWAKIDYKFLTLLLLVFLIFSKVLSNQYWAWFLFMIPLIEFRTLIKRAWVINIFLIILTTILHTYIYPLNYSAWLSVLTERKMDLFLVWIVIISNLILPVLAIRIGIDVFKNKE